MITELPQPIVPSFIVVSTEPDTLSTVELAVADMFRSTALIKLYPVNALYRFKSEGESGFFHYVGSLVKDGETNGITVVAAHPDFWRWYMQGYDDIPPVHTYQTPNGASHTVISRVNTFLHAVRVASEPKQ